MKTTCNISLEISQQELQLCFILHLDSRSARKIMGFQSRGSPGWRDFRTPTWESRERKAIWMWALWRGAEYTIRGKVVASPKSGRGESCAFVLLMASPRVLQLGTNHLVLVLCRHVWASEACQLFLVPSQSSSTPLYPSKCCELGNVPRLFFLPLFPTSIHIWVLQRIGSASMLPLHYNL
jgi:hypothetical protein